MSTFSASIFEVGYKYSSLRFLWVTSKVNKLTPRQRKDLVTYLFSDIFNNFSSALLDRYDFVRLGHLENEITEEYIREIVEKLNSVRQHIKELQQQYNIWCRCETCYKKRLSGKDDNDVITNGIDGMGRRFYFRHSLEDLRE
jgi:hypothetical protein